MNNVETPYLTTREQTEVLFLDGKRIENFNDFMTTLETSFEQNNQNDVVFDMINFYNQNSADRTKLKEELGIQLSTERQEVLVNK